MEIAIIILSLTLIVLLMLCIGIVVFAYKQYSFIKEIKTQNDIRAEEHINLLKENTRYKELQSDYAQFFDLMTETLKHDTTFLRSELAKRIGSGVPEYQDMNNLMHQFEIRIDAIRTALEGKGLL